MAPILGIGSSDMFAKQPLLNLSKSIVKIRPSISNLSETNLFDVSGIGNCLVIKKKQLGYMKEYLVGLISDLQTSVALPLATLKKRILTPSGESGYD